MKDRIFGVLQRVGRSFMLPIAVLPAAGLPLGIDSSFTSATTIQTCGLERILDDETILNALLVIMTKARNVISDDLPIIFAVGVAIGMAKVEKEVAALPAMIVFFVIHVPISAVLIITGKVLPGGTVAPGVLDGATVPVCGIQALQMDVFEGIIVGLGAAAPRNRCHKITLSNAISFFSGSHFVPVISMMAYVRVGMVMYFIWPIVQDAIFAPSDLVMGTGYAGTLAFSTVKRVLTSFGLHHIFYMPFQQAAMGDTMMADRNLIQGGQSIFFAQLALPGVAHFSAGAARYFSSEPISMTFGLPSAALAMYRPAKPEKRRTTRGLLLSTTLVSMLAGITEPIEFSFLFVAPMLFAIQVTLAGGTYTIAHIPNITVGLTFSDGFLDLLIFDIFQGNEKTNWMRVILVGIIYFLLYYFIFSLLIRRPDLKIPDRGDENGGTKLHAEADVNARKSAGAAEMVSLAGGRNGGNGDKNIPSMDIARGLGERRSITSVGCCATHPRCSVDSPALVDRGLLKAIGVVGVVKKRQGIQVIHRLNATAIKSNLERYLAQAPDEALGKDIGSYQEKHIIYSPFNSKTVPIAGTPDETFSSKAAGDGYMVVPTDEQALAPEDGEVLLVSPPKHAISLRTGDGMEYLLHIGVDAVRLGGEESETLVKNGQKVKKDQELMRFNLEYIRANAASKTYMAVLTGLIKSHKIRMVKTGEVRTLDGVGWY